VSVEPGSQPLLRVVIADDEPLGRMRLRRLLEAQPDVEIVGVVADGASAIEAVQRLSPDLLFLDVEMPRKTGVEVVRELGAELMPPTIFVTAYDQYAIEAFDFAAVDYLVKPFDDDRFERALDRARQRLEMQSLARIRGDLMRLLRSGERAVPEPQQVAETNEGRYLERIAVQTKGRLRVVPVSAIRYITADGPYAHLHLANERHTIRQSLRILAQQLDPSRFIRTHRSAIVRLDLIESLVRTPSGEYQVQLNGGVRLKVSRSRRNELQRRLGRL